jgi:hypothetical protein
VNRLIFAVLAAFIAALLVASELDGALGTGVVAGYSLGAGLAGLSMLYTRHVLGTRPTRALAASLLGFFVKLATLVGGALAFRFVEPLAARADGRAFLISFAAAVALILPLGTWLILSGRTPKAAGAARP